MISQNDKRQLFEEMGGIEQVNKVTKVFYDYMYNDPWLSQFFEGIPRDHIESQQNLFMQAALGGDNRYGGKTPPSAHQHINITEEVYQARQSHLKQAFKDTGTSSLMANRWLELDELFHDRIVKESIGDCIMRYSTEGIRDFKKPL
jgi:truncated hemoglobin YjbI